ncbi:hypothetical protein DUNSADRAFT_16256 [Dunaliella salina]|uniref:SRR1-like domain-containing protein n=1 Tax=Dunaliella salina TaxID=3046 RepID=A0ABQ7H158_DUNSA|nr:hypothetical protein DUNSADRAFT_16256 [Dunaliella salina]|eukprot:KAF5840593.1 hypothetical protein DUNSADRAFT_16256 [Dunaliella salina]
MADDEWVVVGGSGKAKKGSKRGSSQLAQQPIQAQAPTAVPHAIPAAVAPLPGWEGGTAEGCASQSVPRLLAPQHGWHHVKEFVIFGLGSMQTSSTSRYQLAMASLLATKLLPGLQAPPMAFDPAFTPADVALLHLMGIAVISNNQLCAHRAHVPTFFYLPHLEGRLCDNLLAANSSRADRAPHASTMHTPEGGSNMGMLPQRFESSNMSTPPQRLDSVDSASHPSTAHAPNNGCSNVGMQPPNVVCTQADGSGVSSAQGSCSSATYAPDFTSNSAEETASEVICGGRTESCETKECSSNAPGSPPGTCTNHRHQHTLHNCVLLANRFSTYEGRAPGTTASVGGGPGRCLGIKQGGKGGKGRKLGGHTEGSQHGNGAADAAQGGGGGLEALLASGRPATMVSLVSAGAVLELQVKEDKHFPSPSAFNDMALHIIP